MSHDGRKEFMVYSRMYLLMKISSLSDCGFVCYDKFTWTDIYLCYINYLIEHLFHFCRMGFNLSIFKIQVIHIKQLQTNIL